jgi:O-acetyl-ADP-ribose deacetylase
MPSANNFAVIQHTQLEITSGDLTEEHVDAIVNAANAYLQHGGGVAGAIVRKGGQIIQQESEELVTRFGRVAHARPVYTSGGKLPCKYVIHAVGPIWGEGDEDMKLAEAIRGSLDLAEKLELTSISFPAISTGIYGFPKARAAKIILSSQKAWLETHPNTQIQLIRNILFDDPSVLAYQNEFSLLFS